MISWSTRFVGTYESSWSIAHKLAWLNVVDVPQALSAVADCRISPSPPSGLRSFNQLGWWEALLVRMSHDDACASCHISLVDAVLGSKATRRFRTIAYPLVSSHLRLCLACIRSGYHSIVHQLDGLVRCPIHGARLINTCPSCRCPLGFFGVAKVRGFRCECCGKAWLRNDELAVQSEEFWANERNAIAPLVTWIERAMSSFQLAPRVARQMFGSWGGGRMRLTSLSEALLPALADLEPCPLDQRFLAPKVPQLVVNRAKPQTKARPVAPSDAVTLVKDVITTTTSCLRRTILRKHCECYKQGVSQLRGSRDYLSFHPEFCQRAYAFALWHDRVNDFLSALELAQMDTGARVVIDPKELKRHIYCAYHGALHGIVLLREFFLQGDKSELQIVRTSACLERNFDPWLAWTIDDDGIWRLDVGSLEFSAAADGPELYCDEGAMVDAIWSARSAMIGRLRERKVGAERPAGGRSAVTPRKKSP